MRLWTIHPKYLDVKGLVALWREGLLAQKVLSGKTKGYRNHPQLIRFKEVMLKSVEMILVHVVQGKSIKTAMGLNNLCHQMITKRMVI